MAMAGDCQEDKAQAGAGMAEDRPAQPGDRLSTWWGRSGPTPLQTKGYRNWVEEQIEEAMARGDFDRLPGKGKPLDLSGDPWSEKDWLVNHILANAHVLPEWVELGKEIRAEIAALRQAPPGPDRAERIRALNRKIDRYNLLVPSISLQLPRLPVDG